ncbi:hypothetical protein ACLQ2R_03285 [Streptosporangium sp. DT93]|uniref:hypothetical protein n=1 Tax=Streptosporangium sp. DT93 TaxID=3393428 RepID=UPI003CF78718
MTGPALVVFLLIYAVIGAVCAAAAYPRVWSDVIDHGTPGSPRDGGLGTVYIWACCLILCLLVGLTWPVTVPAWLIRQRSS